MSRTIEDYAQCTFHCYVKPVNLGLLSHTCASLRLGQGDIDHESRETISAESFLGRLLSP